MTSWTRSRDRRGSANGKAWTRAVGVKMTLSKCHPHNYPRSAGRCAADTAVNIVSNIPPINGNEWYVQLTCQLGTAPTGHTPPLSGIAAREHDRLTPTDQSGPGRAGSPHRCRTNSSRAQRETDKVRSQTRAPARPSASLNASLNSWANMME